VHSADNHEHTIGRKVLAGQRDQAGLSHRAPGRPLYLEAQLDRCGDPIDVLAAKAGRTDETIVELAAVENDGFGHLMEGHARQFTNLLSQTGVSEVDAFFLPWALQA